MLRSRMFKTQRHIDQRICMPQRCRALDMQFLLLSVVVNVRFFINARRLFHRQIKKRMCIV